MSQPEHSLRKAGLETGAGRREVGAGTGAVWPRGAAAPSGGSRGLQKS